MNAIASYQYETLQVSITSNILTVTINRPHKKNAMSFQVINELIKLAGRISKDKTIRAVILNGAEETFCAGIDLSDLNHPKNRAYAFWELIKPSQSAFQRVCLVWRDLPVPVIAVLEGYCIGAGLQLALACDVPGGSILAPLPGFVMYAMSAQLQGLKFIGVDLTPDFELDEAAMLAAIAQHKPSITYLAYPNNPTANLWDDAVIEKIIEAVGAQGGLVVMDEAYQPFASKSYAGRMAKHGHVLLMRTLSKFGLAGVRLGYMIGPKALIAEIDKVRPPYNISVLNYECALFALEHREVFEAQAQELISQRGLLFDALGALPGVKAWPSHANMILIRVPDAARTFDGLRNRKVLVKNISKMHPLLANCLRLTVGTAEENAQLLAALESSL